jgi:hypothetical protein
MSKPGSSPLLEGSHSGRWALLVGVNHYADAAISSLRVCTSDVQAVYDILAASGYAPDQTRLLLSPGTPASPATRAEVLSALVSMAQAADEGDWLLFYFSGHGIDHDGHAYLLPSDARYTTIGDTGINLDRVKQILQDSAAQAKVIILDACHSGAQIGKAPSGMTEDFVRHVFEEAEGLAILASCKQKQVSWEWPEQGRSVFTHYLLEGLSGAADLDKKGFVTVEDVSRYVTDKVKTWAVQRSRVQTPTLQCAVVGDIVLASYASVTSSIKNPFIYGRAMRPVEFLNREDELRTVFNRLRNGESTAIVGEPHIGKSSLLLKLADERTQQDYLKDDAQFLLVSYLDLHTVDDNYNPGAFWEEALEPLWEHPNHWVKPRHFREVIQAGYARRPLERLFNRLGENGRRLVLLLDEFERLLVHPNFQSPSFFTLLRSLASRTGGLALVTASRASVAEMNDQSRCLLETGSPFFNIMIDIPLRSFDERAVNNLLSQASNAFSSDDRHFIRRVAGRHPFLLQAMAATLLETGGEDRHARASQRFYERVASHFDDLWHSMNDHTRTASAILSLVELGGRAWGQEFAFGEIERVDRLGLELRKMAGQGLAERVGEGWQFDRERLLLWQGERWTVGAQAFAWWVRDVVIAESRQVPTYDEWLANKRYRLLLTQEHWDRLLKSVRSAPEWMIRGVGTLARALIEELVERKEQ